MKYRSFLAFARDPLASAGLQRLWKTLQAQLSHSGRRRPDRRRLIAQSSYVHQSRRIDWVDYAKGVCVIWVVALYSTKYVQETMHSAGWMQHVIDFGRPFRMPDFFLISGLFVARVISRPWRSYIDSKILYFLYFYALWVTIRFVNVEVHNLLGPDRIDLIPEYLRLFIEPPSSGPLWFIYILALFFAAVRILRWVPAPLLFASAALLHAASFKTGVVVLDLFSRYFVFFYTGFVAAPHVFRLAEWARSHSRSTLAILAVWIGANTAFVEFQWASLPGIALVLGYAGAIAIMFSSTLLLRISWMRWLAYVGQHSIVIYLGFLIPLKLTGRFSDDLALFIDVGGVSLALTGASVFGALLFYWSVRNTPLRFLFSRPGWTSFGVTNTSGAPGVNDVGKLKQFHE